MAVWQGDVQDRVVCHSYQYVRQRVFSDCHECGEIPVRGVGAEEWTQAQAPLCALCQRHHLDGSSRGRVATCHFLHHSHRVQRGPVLGQVPRPQRRRAVLARPLSRPEGVDWLSGAFCDNLSVLPATAALHHAQARQRVRGQKAVQSDQIGDHRGAVLLLVLAAQPGTDHLGHPD